MECHHIAVCGVVIYRRECHHIAVFGVVIYRRGVSSHSGALGGDLQAWSVIT